MQHSEVRKLPRANLGQNIRDIREEFYGWSQEQLAWEANVPQSLINRIEEKKEDEYNGDPKLSQLFALAVTLKVHLGDLFKPGSDLVMIDAVTRDRLLKKVWQRGPKECWDWLGARRERCGVFHRKGYGVYQYQGKRCHPHRLIYAIYKPLMENWDIDHTCNNKGCVNINHLEVVTRGTNLHRRDQRLGMKRR